MQTATNYAEACRNHDDCAYFLETLRQTALLGATADEARALETWPLKAPTREGWPDWTPPASDEHGDADRVVHEGERVNAVAA